MSPVAAEVMATVVGCVLASVALWPVVSLPSRLLSAVVPKPTCDVADPDGMAAFVCTGGVGLLTALPPLLVVAGLFWRRDRLRQLVGGLTPKIPPQFRAALAPVMATGVFTAAFGEVHRSSADASGFVPQRLFPAVVGLLVYAGQRWGKAVVAPLSRAVNARNRVPVPARFGGAMVLPVLAAFGLDSGGSLNAHAQTEQIVILLALLGGFAATVEP